jgi:chemotaxis methyl-accepting protein methylase
MIFADLKDVHYERISNLVYELCGTNLHEGKKDLVKSRRGKRLKEGNFKSFGEYYHYVTTETQEALVRRFHQRLSRGGYLFVGHSESLNGLSHEFKYVEPSVYRKQV